MPLAMQVKLLRVLEEGEVRRIGSNEPVHVDVRILSAVETSLSHSQGFGQSRAGSARARVAPGAEGARRPSGAGEGGRVSRPVRGSS